MPATFTTPGNLATIKRETTNYSLAVPRFDAPGWGTHMERNLDIIDAIIFAITGIPFIRGVWENDTDYEVDDRVVDQTDGTIWTCLIAHTSAATGSFAADRATNPTYWAEYTVSAGLPDGDYGDIVVSGGGAVMSIDAGVIVNDDINAAAAIDATKIADGSVSNAEFQRLDATSSIQTQLDGKQPLDADLTSIAALTTNAYGRSLLEVASEAALKALINLEIGVDVQAWDAQLDTWATLTPSANAQSLVTAANYAAMRALLDLEAGTDFYSIAGANAAFQGLDATLTSLAAYNTNGLLTQTAADTFAGRTITGTANEIAVSNGNGVGGNPTLSLEAAAKATGRQSFWIGASAMSPRATSGANESTYDSGSNDITIRTLGFDATTQEYAHFEYGMPKGWDEGTVAFTPYWTNTGGSAAQTVRWTLAGVAFSNDDGLNGTFGTAQNSDDTWLAQNDLHIGPESSAITIGGTPAEGDLVLFQLSRDTANDNMSGDAQLIGIMLHMTFNAGNDA